MGCDFQRQRKREKTEWFCDLDRTLFFKCQQPILILISTTHTSPPHPSFSFTLSSPCHRRCQRNATHHTSANSQTAPTPPHHQPQHGSNKEQASARCTPDSSQMCVCRGPPRSAASTTLYLATALTTTT